MSCFVRRAVALLLALTHQMVAQLSESFDAVLPPDLPPGWSSTQERTASDFVTAASLPASPPNCVLAINATIEQALTTASVDLQGLLVHALTFQTRRSSTFRAGLLVEASTDGGASFPCRLGDTLWAGQRSGSYERHRLGVPPHPGDTLRFRWRVIADRSGTSGTLRIDDVALEADPLHDLAARSLEFVPALPGEPLVARVLIANSGILPLPSCEVRLGLDGDGDSLFVPHECVVLGIAAPAPGESLEVVVEAGRSPPGLTRAMAEVHSVLDRHAANDTVYALFRAGVPRGEVVFNEIMYAPLTGEAEYVELFVRAPEEEGLGGWELIVGGPDARLGECGGLSGFSCRGREVRAHCLPGAGP